MSNEEVKVAVVGLGWWGCKILASLEGSQFVKAVVGVDPNAQTATPVCERFGISMAATLEEALVHKDVEAIIIVTPHGLHESQVLAAAQAGKHVFCEKPLALTAESAQRMVNACEARGLVLGIGHERRFEPAVKHLAAAVAEGRLGTLIHIDGNWSHNTMTRATAPGWRQDASQAPGGTFTATGIHVTDIMLSIAGRVSEVHARQAKRSERFSGQDVLDVNLLFESGVTGHMTTLASTPFYSRISVFGDAGWAEIRDYQFADTADLSEITFRDSNLDFQTYTYRPREVVRENIESWAGAVRGTSAYPFTASQLVHNIEILDAIVQSSAAGAPLVIAGR